MARPKKMSDEKLLSGTTKYFHEVCKGNTKLLTLSNIATYLSELYGLDIGPHIVKKSEMVRDYIRHQKNEAKIKSSMHDLMYMPLDAEKFLSNNKTRSQQIAALTALDNKYEQLYLCAVAIQQDNIALIEKNRQFNNKLKMLSKQLEEAQIEREQLNKQLKERNAEIRNQRERISELKAVVCTHVYPDLANELLRDAKMIHLKQETNISKKGKEEIIDTKKDVAAVIKQFKDASLEHKVSNEQSAVESDNTLHKSRNNVIQIFKNELDEL